MESVAIFPIYGAEGESVFRAVSRAGSSEGRTAGEALDAACAAITAQSSPTIVLIQPFGPDEFFSAQQHERLTELMSRKKAVIEGGPVLTASEDAELRSLVEAEWQAAIRRTEQVLQRLG